jgi:hypothetical protein
MPLTTLSRRATFALGAATLLVPTVALADTRCTRIAAGEEACTVGLEGSSDVVRQLKPHWCWAACIQTIFATHGYNVPQQRIVQKVFGNPVDEAANAKEILSAINGRWTSDPNKNFEADGFILWDRVADFERPDALATAVKELGSGNPLIFANDRHTMVLTSMTYSEDHRGGINVESLTVRDPWPESPARHILAPDEVARSGLLCGVHVNPVVA